MNWYIVSQKVSCPIEEELENTNSKEEIVYLLKKYNINWKYIDLNGNFIISMNCNNKIFIIDDFDFPQAEEANEWIYKLNDYELYKYVGERDFNKEFWNSGIDFVYHGTSEEYIENIKVNGLNTGNKTRGMSNKHVGNAIFTSENIDSAYSSYDVILKVDVEAMRDDRYMPLVRKEPDVEISEYRNSLAYKIGLEDFSDEAEQGMSYDTVIFYGNIPAKYLEVVK